MLMITRTLSISICTLSLSACMIDGTNNTYTYQTTPPSEYSSLYPEGYETVSNFYPEPVQDSTPQNIVIPQSYHVNAYQSPTPSKDVDKSWVTSQNPQGYTIELAQGDKAARVANVLYKAPKKEHMAEVKYQQGGKTYYRGLYGTYPSYEAAQQTLNTLPEDLKQSAGIKTWSSVQSNVSE